MKEGNTKDKFFLENLKFFIAKKQTTENILDECFNNQEDEYVRKFQLLQCHKIIFW